MPVESHRLRRLRPACRISACTLSWDISHDNRHIEDDRAGSEPGGTDVSGTLGRRTALVDRTRVLEVALDSPPDTKDMAAGRTGHPRGSFSGMIGIGCRIGLLTTSSAISESLVDSEAA